MYDELLCTYDGMIPEEAVFRASAANRAVDDPPVNTDVTFHDSLTDVFYRDCVPLSPADKIRFKQDFKKKINDEIEKGNSFGTGLIVGHVYGNVKRGARVNWICAEIVNTKGEMDTCVSVSGWKRK